MVSIVLRDTSFFHLNHFAHCILINCLFLGRLVEGVMNQLKCSHYTCRKAQKVCCGECHAFDQMKSMRRRQIKYRLRMKKRKRQVQLEPVCHCCSVFDYLKKNKSVGFTFSFFFRFCLSIRVIRSLVRNLIFIES